MILSFLSDKKRNSHKQSSCFCCNNRQPDSIDPKDDGKQQDSGNLEYQRAQERDRSRYRSVAERGKKRGREDIKAGYEETHTVKPESMAGHGKQFSVISDKNSSKRCGKELG